MLLLPGIAVRPPREPLPDRLRAREPAGRASPASSGSSTGRPSARRAADMAEWIYFIHPPRDNFAATMTDEEKAVWGVHFERFQRLLAEGTIVLVGPTLGPIEHRDRDPRGARRGRRPPDHGRGPGDRRRLRPRRAAAVPGLAAARPRLTGGRPPAIADAHPADASGRSPAERRSSFRPPRSADSTSEAAERAARGPADSARVRDRSAQGAHARAGLAARGQRRTDTSMPT